MYQLNIANIFENLKSMRGELPQKMIIGSFWIFLLRIIHQIFGLARLVILSRILTPSDFGIIGIALLTMSTLDTFSQTGFQEALIQKKENIEEHLNSAWTISIIRGFLIFGILYFGASLVSSFFDTPEAESIIKVIGISVIFQAFTNIGVIYFQKELEFRKEFIYQFSGTIFDFIVSILAVFVLKNVWAIVLGLLAGNFVRLLISYFIHPYRPKISTDFSKIKELFRYGKWILSSSIVAFILTEGDDIFAGKVLGVTALGLYQMSYKISNLPATEISKVISQITFPAYSKIQDDLYKLKETYMNILKITSFLSFPIAGMILLFASDITLIFFGEKWAPMIPSMQILAFWGLIRCLVGTITPLFQSIGKPKIVTKLQFIQAIILFAIIYPLTIKFGIVGTSFAVLSSALIMFFIRNQILMNYMKFKFIEYYGAMFVPLVFTVISALTVFILKNILANSANIYLLTFFSCSFIVVYLTLLGVYLKILSFDIRSILKGTRS